MEWFGEIRHARKSSWILSIHSWNLSFQENWRRSYQNVRWRRRTRKNEQAIPLRLIRIACKKTFNGIRLSHSIRQRPWFKARHLWESRKCWSEYLLPRRCKKALQWVRSMFCKDERFDDHKWSGPHGSCVLLKCCDRPNLREVHHRTRARIKRWKSTQSEMGRPGIGASTLRGSAAGRQRWSGFNVAGVYWRWDSR